MADEKQKIEISTVEGFLGFYNKHFDTTFRVVEHSDNPDFRCANNVGRKLNVEVTSTEDVPGDIQALLGRSRHRTLGKGQPRFVSFDESKDRLLSRITSKLNKDYGADVALVVRDTTGCDWEWNEVAEEIAAALDLSRNPFKEGIWVLTRVKDRLFQIVPPERASVRRLQTERRR